MANIHLQSVPPRGPFRERTEKERCFDVVGKIYKVESLPLFVVLDLWENDYMAVDGVVVVNGRASTERLVTISQRG